MFIRKKKLEAVEESIKTLQAQMKAFMESDVVQRVKSMEYTIESLGHRLSHIGAQLEETDIDNIKETLKEQQSSIDQILEDMEGYKNYKTEKDLLKESDEPWADFETTVTEDGRVAVTMDWNKPFIEMLKKQGIKANNEEDMVSVYFSSLVREAGDELTEEQVSQLRKDG